MADGLNIETVYKKAVATARRFGYRIDDEVRSTIGLAIAHTAAKWTPRHACSYETYAVGIALRLLSRMDRLKETTIDGDFDFFARLYKRDDLQRVLVDFPEPDQSICFAAWIDRRHVVDIALEYGKPLHEIRYILDQVGQKLRSIYEDIP